MARFLAFLRLSVNPIETLVYLSIAHALFQKHSSQGSEGLFRLPDIIVVAVVVLFWSLNLAIFRKTKDGKKPQYSRSDRVFWTRL